NPAFSKSASKVATLSGSTQPKPLLYLDQLDVDVTGTIVVMIGRVWDVNAVTRRYLSTDFVVSDLKGNMIHCSAKSSVAHNFLRMKEGGIYSIKNFVVLPNKDEFRIFRHDRFMIEFDGETSNRKVSADPHGFRRYPFRLIEFDQVEPAHNKYLIDIAGYVTNVRRTSYTKTGSKTLEFYLENQRGQSLRVTLWGKLGDVLVEKKTRHAGVCAMELRADGRKGASRKNEKWVCEACNRAVDYPVFRLEVMVANDTANTVVVMFNDTATEFLKCSAESLMGTEDEGSDADDDLNLPLAIRNLIGTTHVLEIKSHTYYEYGTFESFNCWKINPCETAEDDASSSTPAFTANDAELSKKIVTKPPTVCTPLKPNEERKQKGHELEDSDVDEACGSFAKEGTSSADVAVDTKKKRKRSATSSHNNQRITLSFRGLLQNPVTIHANTIVGPDGRVQSIMNTVFHNKQNITPSLQDLLQNLVSTYVNTIIAQDGRIQSTMNIETTTDYSGVNPLPLPDSTRLKSTDIAGPSTSKYASTRLPRRSPGPVHLHKAKKGAKKAAFTSTVMYHNIGPLTHQCINCNATMWYEEREEKSKRAVNPTFSLCCQGGKVLLPRFHDTPPPLNHLLRHDQPSTAKFKEQIRVYNSMFCFTLFGAKIDHSINTGRAPYTFRINRQNYHRMGSLLPKEGMPPRFAQLYFFDTQNKVKNRTSAFIDKETSEGIDKHIVGNLISMLDRYSSVAQDFRMARDWCNTHNSPDFRLRLHSERKTTRQYNAPTVSEVEAIIINDFGDAHPTRDIVVEQKDTGPQRVSELHPSYIALQYPLLFPYGEDGFHEKIPYHSNARTRKTKRGYVIMKEYYSYIIHQRPLQGNTLLKGGHLFQQYLVDAYTKVEEQRLKWTRNNQDTLRVDLYHNLCDVVTRGDISVVGPSK
ncbi:DNA helicase PIF1, ATP-dependent, partial [Tanacetum coccineum]